MLPPADQGIAAPLRRAARSVADQIELHGELFMLEWRAEKVRLLKYIVSWAITLIFASLTLIFASIALLAALWDGPYRVPAAAALVVLYAGGFVAARVWRVKLALEGEAAFAATREQLAEEGAFLKTLL